MLVCGQQEISLEDVLYEPKTQPPNQYTTKYLRLATKVRLRTSHKPIKKLRVFLKASQIMVSLLFVSLLRLSKLKQRIGLLEKCNETTQGTIF